MTFLPIVERELRAAARKPSTFRARAVVVLLTSALAALLLMVSDPGSSNQMGGVMFQAFIGLAFFYCLIAGIRHGADCLSEEKREGTLGLLFLTDLKGYDVVLGKLAAVSIRTFQGLLAFFPVLSVVLLLGGITVGEFWRSTAVLTNTLFFALCVSLCVSALVRESHVALILVISILVLLTTLPPAFEWASARFWGGRSGLAGAISPAVAVSAAADVAYRVNPSRFWQTLLLNHALGWCFLLLAAKTLPQTWQDRPVRPARSPAEIAGPDASVPRRRTLKHRQWLDTNPILWLALRDEKTKFLLWTVSAVVGFAGASLLLLSFWVGNYMLTICAFLAGLLRLVVKLAMAWHSCATLAEARRTGAVELLLATPLQVEDIIQGHWLALKRMFLWPVSTAVVLTLVPTLLQTWQGYPTGSGLLFMAPLPAMAVFGTVTFLLDVLAVGWVGMWMGLSQAKLMQAFAKTVAFALIIPALIFCLPNILFDLFWISWGRRKLEREFRTAAMERFVPVALERPRSGTAATIALPPIIGPRALPGAGEGRL